MGIGESRIPTAVYTLPATIVRVPSIVLQTWQDIHLAIHPWFVLRTLQYAHPTAQAKVKLTAAP